MNSFPRRQFLRGSLGVAAAAAMPARAWSRLLRTNEDLRVACIGIHGQGQTHIFGFADMEGVRVVALCDVDKDVLDARAKQLADWCKQKNRPQSASPELFRDFRKILERKDIDIVTIATPNHWHSLIAIWACQAGKDVYVEKPVSHNVWEGRKAVEAAAKYGRIVQTGTQSRSAEGVREAIDFVHAGNLGKVLASRGLCYKRRPSIGKTSGDQQIPASVDYDLWTGPAALLPLRRKSLHYDWHWDWNTGNGDIGNQGIHQMDIARWALGVNSVSDRVTSIGGRFGYIDDGQTPNTLVAIHEFGANGEKAAGAAGPGSSTSGSKALPAHVGSANENAAGGRTGAAAPRSGDPDRGSSTGVLIFEVRGLETESNRGITVGNVIECEKGYVALDTDGGKAFNPDGSEARRFESRGDAGRNHRQNFVDAVRSRRAGELHASILEGHLSSALCHTSNASYRVGKQTAQTEARSTVARTGKFAVDSVERLGQHLSDRFLDHVSQFGPYVSLQQIDRTAVRVMLGAELLMDAQVEQFVGAAGANEMLRREYRTPYTVPSEV